MPFNSNATQVLVLGCSHLTGSTPDSQLVSTVAHLTSWRPDAVAIELLPGEVMASFEEQGGSHASLQVGGMPQALRLGALARPHAPWRRAQARHVATQPDTAPSERVLAWLLAYEPLNALLHWTPDLSLPGEVNAAMTEFAGRQGEAHRIALPIVRSLCLPVFHHIDDHTGLHIEEHFGKALEAIWTDPEVQRRVSEHPYMRMASSAAERARAADNYWLYLRHVNSPAAVRDNFDLEVGTFLRSPLSGGAHRARVAQWDTRNLFMAARLRLVTAFHTGERVLALVGSSHKGPLAQALAALAPDVELVGLDALERELGLRYEE